MRYRFFLDGRAYSKSKNAFKRLLKKHGLGFKGSFGNFVWESDREHVSAEFIRDEEKDITISATLTWEGRKKSKFIEELKAWVWELGGKAVEEDVPVPKASEVESRVNAELEFWDSINKPDLERLRASGRPDVWIKRDLDEWKKRRTEKKKELMARLRS